MQRASLVAQVVNNQPGMRETWVQSLGQEDPLKKGMAIHSSILPWRIPWSEKPGEKQSIAAQRVRHDWVTNFHFHFKQRVCSELDRIRARQRCPRTYRHFRQKCLGDSLPALWRYLGLQVFCCGFGCFLNYNLGAAGPKDLGSSRNLSGWEFIPHWMVPRRGQNFRH